MSNIKLAEEYFELIEELIQCGAKKNLLTQLKLNSFICKQLGIKIFLTLIYGKENGKQPNEVEFQYGWEQADERFSSKKTIISNVEWK